MYIVTVRTIDAMGSRLVDSVNTLPGTVYIIWHAVRTVLIAIVRVDQFRFTVPL